MGGGEYAASKAGRILLLRLRHGHQADRAWQAAQDGSRSVAGQPVSQASLNTQEVIFAETVDSCTWSLGRHAGKARHDLIFSLWRKGWRGGCRSTCTKAYCTSTEVHMYRIQSRCAVGVSTAGTLLVPRLLASEREAKCGPQVCWALMVAPT